MKTFITKASIAILFANLFISCSKENATESLVEPSTSIVSLSSNGNVAADDEFIISDRAFLPCANNGDGEWCSISGSGRIARQELGSKPPVVTISRLTAIGENTGDSYALPENRVYKVNADKSFNIIVNTQTGKAIELRLQVGDSNHPELKGSVLMVRSTC